MSVISVVLFRVQTIFDAKPFCAATRMLFVRVEYSVEIVTAVIKRFIYNLSQKLKVSFHLHENLNN